MKKKTILFCTAALVAACSFYGCNDDESIAPEKIISVAVDADGMATKGSTVTTANITEFGLDGYLMKEIAGKERHYINHRPVNKSDGAWEFFTTEGKPYAWASSAIAFWAKAPYLENEELTMGDNYGTMSFDYTLPEHTADNADAEQQKDIAVAYTNVSYADTEVDNYEPGKGMVKFTFGHALAGIRLDISGLADGYSVEKVTLSDIYAGGTCTVTPGTVGLDFAWTLRTEETGTYTQKLTADDFETVTSIGEGDVSETSVLLKESTGKIFFIPPQTFPANAKITLTLVKDEETVVATASLAGKEIVASNMYTFALSSKFRTITINGQPLDWTVESITTATNNMPQASQFEVSPLHQDSPGHADDVYNVYDRHPGAPSTYRQTWVIRKQGRGNEALITFKIFSPVGGEYKIIPQGDYISHFTIGGTLSGSIEPANSTTVTKVSFTVEQNGARDGEELWFKVVVRDSDGVQYSLDSEAQLFDTRGYHKFRVDDPLGRP